ncbi:hypothetical protein F52700_11394 [Fusarium sp. NRRL 52700]|nr:hypothetical protein F52700_11394 [Fusarium sp. NRRL 52700]
MVDHSDAEPKRSPYASDPCAVYFSEMGPLYIPCSLLSEEMKEAADFRDDDSSHPLTELWLDDITLDVGHVIIHYLVTGTYQCLQQQEEGKKEEDDDDEKDFSAEFATAIRVYVATGDSLPLPALREMAREEIVRVGEWLSLPDLIKVMEEAALSFKAYPGIATYVESRLLSYSQFAAKNSVKAHVDKTLAALGAPDTLSQVILRSVLLSKASEDRQQEEPTYQPAWGYTGLELRPTKRAMERAEMISLRNAEAASDEREIRQLQKIKVRNYGKLSINDQQRLRALEDNAEKRAEEVASEGEQNAQRWNACEWPAPGEDVDPYEPAPVFSRASSEVPEPKDSERQEQGDILTYEDRRLTAQFTPGSSQGSSEDEVVYGW